MKEHIATGSSLDFSSSSLPLHFSVVVAPNSAPQVVVMSKGQLKLDRERQVGGYMTRLTHETMKSGSQKSQL